MLPSGLSPALAALVFLVFAFAARRRGESTDSLTIPMGVTSLWSTLLAIESWTGIGVELVGVTELGRDFAWVIYLRRRFHITGNKSELTVVSSVVLSVAFVAHVVALVTVHEAPRILAGIISPLLISIILLALIEQVWRNTPPGQRWAVKLTCLGLGAIFSFDFYLYSEALLFERPEPVSWAARGVVHVMAAPLLWIGQRRLVGIEKSWGLTHRMVLHTVAIVGSGIYLMVMAAVGYFIRATDSDWGVLLQMAFLASAGLLLALVLLSGAVRARLRDFLGRNFFRYRYDYREQWLRFTALLDAAEANASLHIGVIEAMARLVDGTGSALWLRREQGIFRRVAVWNMSLDGNVALTHPFIHLLKDRQKPLDLMDLRERVQMEGSPPDWLLDSPRAWLVVPLIWHEHLIGFVVLAPPLAGPVLDWEITELLHTAARQAAAYIAQAEAAEALSLARQFESFHRTSAFVVHDIKNLVAQLSLLLSNARRFRDNPEFQEDMLATIESAVDRMNRMLRKLAEPPAERDRELLDMSELLRSVISAKAALKPMPQFLETDEKLFVYAQPERLQRVLGHVIQNATEATPEDGLVGVTLNRDSNWVVVTVTDTGQGMDEAFVRDKLFRPFYSTKGAGMGIGAYECKEYIESLTGFLRVSSRPGHGTCLEIHLPLAPRTST
jgi:putative PEP-CTERM system histidine kinase